jgi:putative ABC transport system permease protein
MTLVAAFAVLALLMASVGLYGVLSYSVTRRTPEIGVRMALGARRATVVIDIVRTALLLAGVGIVLGTAAAFVATRLLSAELFSVGRADPATFAATAAVVIVMALVASWLPAQRAASVDPLLALRAE